MDKYLSIITNFGCHGKCPYCIVRENGIDVPNTTIQGLNELENSIKQNNCNIVSVSGGGDPLHNYERNKDYYSKLIRIVEKNNIPLEMHTSYIHSEFPVEKCSRVVYHLRSIEQLHKIKRCGDEKVRVVFVVTKDYLAEDLLLISKIVDESQNIDELSFRQLVDSNYETQYYNHNVLIYGHKKGLWHYIEQNDYNLYYVNGKLYTEFSKIHK